MKVNIIAESFLTGLLPLYMPLFLKVDLLQRIYLAGLDTELILVVSVPLSKLAVCGSLPLLRLFDPLAKLFNLVGMGADFIFALGWLDVAHLCSPFLNV